MPAGWRCGGGVYKLQYSHRLCGDSVVMVVAVSLGSALIINGECESGLSGKFQHQPMTTFALGPWAGMLEVNQSADSVCKLCVEPSSYVTEAWPGKAVIGQAVRGVAR